LRKPLVCSWTIFTYINPTITLQRGKRGIQKLKQILENVKNLKRQPKNISSKRFDQAIEKTSGMLLNQVQR
jgi:hypothetical protein